jgi:hypothetical protein
MNIGFGLDNFNLFLGVVSFFIAIYSLWIGFHFTRVVGAWGERLANSAEAKAIELERIVERYRNPDYSRLAESYQELIAYTESVAADYREKAEDIRELTANATSRKNHANGVSKKPNRALT